MMHGNIPLLTSSLFGHFSGQSVEGALAQNLTPVLQEAIFQYFTTRWSCNQPSHGKICRYASSDAKG